MNIQNWSKSAYVTIGNPPFFRLEGNPSEEGKPPRFDFPVKRITVLWLRINKNQIFLHFIQKWDSKNPQLS